MKARDLMEFKDWIVVGDILNTTKYAHKILKSLKKAGFNVVGVNPKSNNIEVYRTLQEVPYNIQVIDLCINPKSGLEIVREAKKLNITKVLIQPGAESEEILAYCKENNIMAIEGCALVELSNLNH